MYELSLEIWENKQISDKYGYMFNTELVFGAAPEDLFLASTVDVMCPGKKSPFLGYHEMVSNEIDLLQERYYKINSAADLVLIHMSKNHDTLFVSGKADDSFCRLTDRPYVLSPSDDTGIYFVPVQNFIKTVRTIE